MQAPEKRLKKLEADYQQKKYQEELAKDPINVLTEENKKLKADCMRLEAETDSCSNELATLKVIKFMN